MKADVVTKPSAAQAERELAAEGADVQNWLVLAVHLVLFRIGWVFKTESVIVPALVDVMAGPGWVRGCLPVLNRLGQSVPPALLAERLKRMPYKRTALCGAMLAMGALMLIEGAVCLKVDRLDYAWMPPLFLAVYTAFSAAAGLHQMAWGTTQGKLVRAHWRGRLFTVATCAGVIPSALLAWWLLDGWLARADGGFGLCFLACGGVLCASAVTALGLAERAEASSGEGGGEGRHWLADAWRVLAGDADFRWLCLVAMLFGAVPILFPHYQSLARERLGITGGDLAWFVVTQNLALGLVSLVTGPLADRRGNRAALRLLIFATAITPVLAIGLVHLDVAVGRSCYWLVFAPLGLTPVTLKTLVNYTLELAPRDEHPRYLSTISLCVLAPFLASPLVGWLVDLTSYEAVLLAGAAVIFLSGVLTRWLVEPRHHDNAAPPA